MRYFLPLTLLVAIDFGATGCGSKTGQAEALVRQMIDEHHRIADGLDAGDMEAAKTGFKKFAENAKAVRDLKLTKAQDVRLTGKLKPQMDAAQVRLRSALAKAILAKRCRTKTWPNSASP